MIWIWSQQDFLPWSISGLRAKGKESSYGINRWVSCSSDFESLTQSKLIGMELCWTKLLFCVFCWVPFPMDLHVCRPASPQRGSPPGHVPARPPAYSWETQTRAIYFSGRIPQTTHFGEFARSRLVSHKKQLHCLQKGTLLAVSSSE